jgi:hypothetical protein
MIYHENRAKLSVRSLGLAAGITKGLAVMLLAWAGYFWHVGGPMIANVASIYHGYGPTIMGGVKGGLWGLLAGFVIGVVFAVIYNFCHHICYGKTYVEEERTRRP